MNFRAGLALALLTLLSNDSTRTLAQYVTTVTVSINTDPFCTSLSGLQVSGNSAGNASGSGASGMSGGGAGGSGFGSGPGVLNESASVTGFATNSRYDYFSTFT